MNTTQLVTTYDNSDVSKACDARKSTAIIRCNNGILAVSGALYDDLGCQTIPIKEVVFSASCTHPVVGTISSGENVEQVTYSQPSVTSPASCDSVKKVLIISCNNGNLATSGEVESYQSCIQNGPASTDCFDPISQRSIIDGKYIQITSYRGPEYSGSGLCNHNMLNYIALCNNGVVTRIGTIGSFLTCQEVEGPRSGTGKFTYLPYGPPSVSCQGTLQLTIQNLSNKQMYIDENTLAFIGPKSQINYRKYIQVLRSNCSSSLGLSPGAGCGILIKNNVQLAVNQMATPLVSIKARYGSEIESETIDSGVYDGIVYSPWITFIGCN